ncbi:MAG: DUF5685 family protein [Bacillota bacterium]|nr:DUF5685 family protein [Bacillota bacterium]
MLGYVQIHKPDLKVREYEIYQGYYCGICKYIGSRYGQLPRMTLSYDAAFLACLLASVDDTPDSPLQEHCAIHHIKKKTIIRNAAIEYAGDVMLILARYKLLDDVLDENSRRAKALLKLYRGIHRKLLLKYPDLLEGIEWNLALLNGLEKEKCASIDMVADPFAHIMEVIFREGSKALYGDAALKNDKAGNLHETFAKTGYHMGKWIYLMDAADDIEENIADGSYNPLLYRFNYSGCTDKHVSRSDHEEETADEFKARIRDDLEFNLYHYLAVIAEHTAELDIKKNKGIIENIIYFGMNRKTEAVLDKTVEPADPAEEKTQT